MIRIYIYTSKNVKSTISTWSNGDIHFNEVNKTLTKGGGLYKFNGTREEFINKVVQEKYLNNPFGYEFTICEGCKYNFFDKSVMHTLANSKNFITGIKLNDEFLNFLKVRYNIPKTYLSAGNNGAGIFIIEDNDLEEIDF